MSNIRSLLLAALTLSAGLLAQGVPSGLTLTANTSFIVRPAPDHKDSGVVSVGAGDTGDFDGNGDPDNKFVLAGNSLGH